MGILDRGIPKFDVGDVVVLQPSLVNNAVVSKYTGKVGKVTKYENDGHADRYIVDIEPNRKWYSWELKKFDGVYHKIDCNITENFFKERKRMCDSLTCSNCPLHSPLDNCADIVVFHYDKAMEIVQKWSDEHPEEPVKTFADDFFDKFPNALKDENGVPCVGCPHHFGYCEYKCDHNCKECWNRPLSEVKK